MGREDEQVVIYDDNDSMFGWSDDYWDHHLEGRLYYGQSMSTNPNHNSWAEFELQGRSKFALRGDKVTDHGSFEIIINGTLVATESGFDIEHSPDVDNVGQWSNTTLYQSEWLPEGRHSIRYVNVGPQTDIEEEYMTGSDLSYLVLDSLVVTYRTSNSESEQTNLLSDPSILESSPSETSEIVHSPSPNTAHRPISEANVSKPSISTTATTSVTGTTSVRSEKESSSSDSPSSGSPPDAAIIGLAIGCSALICIFFALAWRVFRRRRMGDRSSDWRTVKSWAASSHSSESKAEEAGRIESGFGS